MDNPWDSDPIVTAAPPPAPVPVSATQGVIERPGQAPPPYANVAPGQPAANPWDSDPITTPAPPPKPPSAFETASGPAAAAAMSAAGGPLGVAPLLGAPVVAAAGAGPAVGGAVKVLYDKLPEPAKIFLWQKVFDHIPGGKLLHHLHEAISGGGEEE